MLCAPAETDAARSFTHIAGADIRKVQNKDQNQQNTNQTNEQKQNKDQQNNNNR